MERGKAQLLPVCVKLLAHTERDKQRLLKHQVRLPSEFRTTNVLLPLFVAHMVKADFSSASEVAPK